MASCRGRKLWFLVDPTEADVAKLHVAAAGVTDARDTLLSLTPCTQLVFANKPLNLLIEKRDQSGSGRRKCFLAGESSGPSEDC